MADLETQVVVAKATGVPIYHPVQVLDRACQTPTRT